jgi:hypothetical protein
MLNIPIIVVMPLRPVTNGITHHIIVKTYFIIITTNQITHHTIPIMVRVRTII